jgi:hypothetical protein
VAAFTDTPGVGLLITLQASGVQGDLRQQGAWSNPNLRVSDEYEVTGNAAINDPSALFSQDQNALNRMAGSHGRSSRRFLFLARVRCPR